MYTPFLSLYLSFFIIHLRSYIIYLLFFLVLHISPLSYLCFLFLFSPSSLYLPLTFLHHLYLTLSESLNFPLFLTLSLSPYHENPSFPLVSYSTFGRRLEVKVRGRQTERKRGKKRKSNKQINRHRDRQDGI